MAALLLLQPFLVYSDPVGVAMHRCFKFLIAPRCPASLIPVILLAVSALAPAIWAADVPVVVAVDTSRSLSPTELRSTTSNMGAILAVLPAGTPVGLMAFDDSPRWIVEPTGSREAVEGALAELTPAGNFTLLNDALFTAARDLTDGGVILLLTDGRDENSATTVEDVAELCQANHVRIVALSIGRNVDEKALRRLSLLTEGASLGSAAQADTIEVGLRLQEAAVASAADVEASRPPVEPVQDTDISAASALQEKTTVVEQSVTPRWLLPLLLILILAVLTTLVVLWRSRSALQQAPEASHPPGDWETDPSIAAPPAIDHAQDPTFEMGTVPPIDESADELVLDPSTFDRLPFDGDIDTTSVLDEQHIISVMEPGKEIRSFRLRHDRAFAVGRAPRVNTLTLDSRALTSQHFKVVPHEGGFAVVDLDSTNGTLVNGRRIKAHHLEAGDTIQAGEVEFEFKVILRSLM